MKKIMFVIGCLAGGGAERVVSSVASALSEKNYDVSILTYYKEQNEYPYSPKINRINISNGNINDYNKMTFLKKIKMIRKHIKKEQPDEIICFLPHTLTYVFFSLLLTKYRKRLTYAVRANPNMENDKISKIQKKLLRYVKRIITQNKGQKECLNPKLQAKTIVIPNPMYNELFNGEKKYLLEPLNIVSVGRLNNQKNYELAIDAFEIISKGNININYYIYGAGPLESKLKKMIVDKNLDKKIHIMGFEKDRSKIYNDKDIFLMTSKFEGMPNALAEAMCKGIPAISTDCDFGPRDLIMNDDMGILLKDFEVNTLVCALENVINNYNLFIEKAQNAKEILKENYAFDKIISKWIEIF